MLTAQFASQTLFGGKLVEGLNALHGSLLWLLKLLTIIRGQGWSYSYKKSLQMDGQTDIQKDRLTDEAYHYILHRRQGIASLHKILGPSSQITPVIPKSILRYFPQKKQICVTFIENAIKRNQHRTDMPTWLQRN